MEEIINFTNERYRQSGLALFQKIPTPITPVQIDAENRTITLAYFEKHDNRVNVETVKELNKLSKEIEENGLFAHILEDMGKKLAQ